jgi:O-antigen/teichoic acid export membrane protein
MGKGPVMRLPHLATQSIVLFAARIAGAGCAFATQVLLVRVLGTPTFADYVLVLAGINIGAAVMPLGFHFTANYFAARYYTTGSVAALSAYLRQAFLHIALGILIAAIGAVALWSFVPLSIRPLVPPAIVFAVAVAVIYLTSGTLIGLKRPIAGFAGDILLRPAFMLATFAIFCFTAAPDDVLTFGFWVLAGLLTLIDAGQVVLVVQTLRGMDDRESGDGETLQSLRRTWWRYALPSTIVVLATDFFFDIDFIIVSPFMTQHEIAIFGVCARICSLFAFGIGTIYTISLPDILDAGMRRDTHRVERELGNANVYACLMAATLSLVMFFSGPLLALIFGKDFASAGLPLGILTLGLAARAALGPGPLVLSVYERPAASVPASVVGIAALAAMNYLLVPRFGLMGAAAAASLAIAMWSFALWLTARRDLALDVSIYPRLRRLLTRS